MRRARLPSVLVCTASALSAAAVLVAGTSPASAVEGGEPYLRTVCDPEQVPDTRFSDRMGLPAPFAVDCLAFYGISRGLADGAFDGGAPVTRAQLARLAFRFGQLHGASFRADDGLGEYVDTADADLELQGALAGLDGAGAMRGFTDGSFRPQEPVTRGQVATILNNLQVFLRTDISGLVGGEASDRYYSPGDPFDDTGDSVHGERIRRAWAAFVVEGVDDRTYAPQRPVTRNQVARLLARVLVREVDPYLGVGFRPPLADPSEGVAGGGTIEPRGAVQLALGDESQRQTYTLSDLAPGEPVRLDLADGSAVLRRVEVVDGAPRTTGWRFRVSRTDAAAADLGTVAARIVSVDGAEVAPTSSLTLRPGSDGRTVVEVAGGDADEEVVPVAHAGGRPDVLDVVPAVPSTRGGFTDRPPADGVLVGAELTVRAGSLLGNPPGSPPLDLTFRPLRSSGVSNEVVARIDGRLLRLSYDNGDSFRYSGTTGAIDGFERITDHSGGDPCRDVLVRVAYDPSRNGDSAWEVVRDEQVDSEECRPEAFPAGGADG